MASSHLQPVGSPARRPRTSKSKPTTLVAAAGVSERALLVMMRQKIATEIDNGVPPHTLAPLSRQLRDIDKEIRALDLRASQEADKESGAADEHWNETAI